MISPVLHSPLYSAQSSHFTAHFLPPTSLGALWRITFCHTPEETTLEHQDWLYVALSHSCIINTSVSVQHLTFLTFNDLLCLLNSNSHLKVDVTGILFGGQDWPPTFKRSRMIRENIDLKTNVHWLLSDIARSKRCPSTSYFA